MSSFMKKMALKKIKAIQADELLQYSKEYNIPITEQQANDIVSYMKKTKLDPFKEKDRTMMFKKLAQITDLPTAQKGQKLFVKLIREYGVESWFE
ncbi:DUF2624 domain-containing protein [Radiobacillus kanasensis]|uniref:DUF2624 domain-containing protein n=1 Tax=Radiobacillus kanasensis TaxID=2844358 RepID=UPI001E4AC5CB|nr:DUF2624 domain-containing protein [Radiobacillus kanasensis]UFT97797.1 DUF2624 domain-containing protein [Radiobacillus kanasensis]